MPEYRAVLIDPAKPNRDRPIQLITRSLTDVEDWVVNTLTRTGLPSPAQSRIDASPQAFVDVYEVREVFLGSYSMEKAKNLAEKKRGGGQS